MSSGLFNKEPSSSYSEGNVERWWILRRNKFLPAWFRFTTSHERTLCYLFTPVFFSPDYLQPNLFHCLSPLSLSLNVRQHATSLSHSLFHTHTHTHIYALTHSHTQHALVCCNVNPLYLVPSSRNRQCASKLIEAEARVFSYCFFSWNTEIPKKSRKFFFGGLHFVDKSKDWIGSSFRRTHPHARTHPPVFAVSTCAHVYVALTEKERERERACVCVWVNVCEWNRPGLTWLGKKSLLQWKFPFRCRLLPGANSF